MITIGKEVIKALPCIVLRDWGKAQKLSG